MSFFDFLKKIIRAEGEPKGTGKVEIIGEVICHTHQRGHRTETKLEELDRISGYAGKDFDGKRFRALVLRAAHAENHITPDCEGFSSLKALLVERLKVSESQFDRIYSEKPTSEWLIWEKFHANTAYFEPTNDWDKARRDLSRGFLVEGEPVIEWGRPLEAIAALPCVKIEPGVDRRRILRFQKAIKLGNLYLEHASINDCHQRKDVPLAFLTGEIRISPTADENFYQTKAALKSLLGAPSSFVKEEHLLEARWEWKGLHFRLFFAYSTPQRLASEAALLTITNARPYIEHTIDQAYEREFAISERLAVAKAFSVPSEFRDNPWLRVTPDPMQHADLGASRPFLVWRDDVNNRVGFANGVWASIIPKKSMLAIEIYRWEPDKGKSYEQLRVRIAEGDIWIVVAEGALGDFSEYRKGLESLTGLRLQESSPWQA